MTTLTEADIFSRIIDSSNPSMSPAAAKAIIALGYTEADHARMAELAAKSNEGSLGEDERRELEIYVSAGDLLSLMKSKARASLGNASAV